LITPDWYSAATFVGAVAAAGPDRAGAAEFDLLLVTCVHGKDVERLRGYAERHGRPWFIISAEHGLVHPDEWLAPSDRCLPDTPPWYQEVWGAWVAARLRLLAGDLTGRTVEIHASAEEAAWVTPWLMAAGAVVGARSAVTPPRGGPRGGP
jgi:hypothetical protein